MTWTVPFEFSTLCVLFIYILTRHKYQTSQRCCALDPVMRDLALVSTALWLCSVRKSFLPGALWLRSVILSLTHFCVLSSVAVTANPLLPASLSKFFCTTDMPHLFCEEIMRFAAIVCAVAKPRSPALLCSVAPNTKILRLYRTYFCVRLHVLQPSQPPCHLHRVTG